MTSERNSSHSIDKVRASRDGHSFHEVWAARVALEPYSTLRILTIEGFSTEDEPFVSGAATEIADLVRYRGGINIDTASAIEVLQFKYSITRADEEVRAFDIKKTLEKFRRTDADFEAGSAPIVLRPSCAMKSRRLFSSALIGPPSRASGKGRNF